MSVILRSTMPHLAPPLDDLVRKENDSRTPSPKMSGSFGGERKALFSRQSSLRESNNNSSNSTNNDLPQTRPTRRKSRSKSFSEQAIRNLAVPVNVSLVICCGLWYSASALSNTMNKSILTAFPYPVTLSMVQFLLAVLFGASTIVYSMRSPQFAAFLPRGFVSGGLKVPTFDLLTLTAPMGCFQLSGHILSHMATSMIPVSLVHTIKALSPLFTVAAYRVLFQVQYPAKTYFSLIPLTIGVIMTCSADLNANFMGLVYALLATLIFVSQNMWSKKLLTPNSDNKLDKLNLLCYCSSLAFIFTFPLWLFSEGIGIARDYAYSRGTFFGSTTSASDRLSGYSLLLAFVVNGFVHFFQNVMAFQVLGMVTPVTYSVASLIKRIVVITVAIIWFSQQVTGAQGFGIVLTFAGLYLYDRFGGDRKKKYSDLKPPVLPK